MGNWAPYFSARNTGYGTLHAPYDLGDLAPTTWCSDKNPQGSCAPVRGICKPTNVGTLNVFKELQAEVNRALGRPTLAVDGRIGPKTLSSTGAAAKAVGIGGIGPYSHCDQLAVMSDAVVAMLRAANNAASKPAVAAPAPRVPPSMPGPGGTVIHPAGIKEAGFAGFVKSPLGMVALAVGGLLLWKSYGKKGRRRSR